MKKEKNIKAEEKIIFHIDVNSAFLSWSAVRKLRDEPGSVDLRTIPAVVGGDRTKRHGIVTAKSLPAKKYGIRTAETIASAMQKCPGLVIVPSDFQTYRESSSGFLKILREYTPLVEQASIDEAYMDATDLCRQRLESGPDDAVESRSTVTRVAGESRSTVAQTAGESRSPVTQTAGECRSSVRRSDGSAGKSRQERLRLLAVELAGQIRQRIFGELGFTVNIGISSNRLLAKMASDFTKPDKTHTLFPEEVEEKMWPLPIGELYGCGSRTCERLRTLGIQTIGDAAGIPVEVLIDHFGEKTGKYIHNASNGIGRAGVSPVREDAKSYSNEWTTSSDITQETYEAEFMPLLQHLCDKVAGRLQRDGVYGKTVVVTVKTDDFRRRSAQRQLPDATNRTEVLFQASADLADKLLLGEKGLFAEGAGIRLVGAGVTDLDDGSYRQMSLLDWDPGEDQAENDVIQQAGKGIPGKPDGAEKEDPETNLQAKTDSAAAGSGEKTDSGLTGPEEKADSVPAGPGDRRDNPSDRAARLREMEARINRRYGDGTVRRGAGSEFSE